jgi:hypothetical protein
MRLTGNIGESASIVCLTPLYHFSSDAPELIIDPVMRVRRLDDCLTIPFDNEVAKHLQVYEPKYIFWHDGSGQIRIQELLRVKNFQELYELFFSPTAKLFALLRLFKPGRLRAGDTFVLWRAEKGGSENWGTLGYGRASAMVVDYHVLASQITSYLLNSTEVPFFRAFRENLAPLLEDISSFPCVQTALLLYGEDNGEQSDVVAAVTALEALLTKKEETERFTEGVQFLQATEQFRVKFGAMDYS